MDFGHCLPKMSISKSEFSPSSRWQFQLYFQKLQLRARLRKIFFGNEVFRVKEDAIKNDEAFWRDNRPIPLTVEESQDYVKKTLLPR